MNMISRFDGLTVGFFGLGKSNADLMNCLPLGNCRVILRSDTKINPADIPSSVGSVKIIEGKAAREDISEDILIFSPSVRRECPEFQRAKDRGVKFSSDAELFFENLGSLAIGITGSDGKSTTSALTHMILEKAGHKSALVGNIGKPMVSTLSDNADFYVCELSSFMLRYISPALKRACITNITPNHLNWHESFDEYKKAKTAILKNAHENVLFDDFKEAFAIFSTQKSSLELIKSHNAEIFLTVENGYICKNGMKYIDVNQVKRCESYNLKNLMCAIALTHGYADKSEIMAIAREFDGLEHRCQTFYSENGVDYIDSSIDTSPARTAETLVALRRDTVLLLGGSDKGLDYSELIAPIKKYVKHAVITGENSQRIYECLKSITDVHIEDDFESAVRLGKEYAKEVGALLLSPASASYDRFKDYHERGRFFKEIVLKCK